MAHDVNNRPICNDKNEGRDCFGPAHSVGVLVNFFNNLYESEIKLQLQVRVGIIYFNKITRANMSEKMVQK